MGSILQSPNFSFIYSFQTILAQADRDEERKVARVYPGIWTGMTEENPAKTSNIMASTWDQNHELYNNKLMPFTTFDFFFWSQS